MAAFRTISSRNNLEQLLRGNRSVSEDQLF